MPVEPDRTPGGGLPLHRGHDRHGDRLGPPAEGADARQAVLRLLRARRHARARTTSRRSGRTSTRASFDDGWDALREETFARQKELGVIPADAELTARPDEIPAWDDMPDDLKPVLARQMEVYAGLPGAHRPPRRPADRRARRPRDPRRHARLLHHRRQRRLRPRARSTAPSTSSIVLNGAAGARDGRVHGLADRRLRHARGLQPLRGRLGARDGHALPVDQAGRLALGRHPQRHDRPLAETASRPRARSAPSSTT